MRTRCEVDDAYIVIYNRNDAYGFGRPLRVLWRTTPDAARLVCSDDRTRGADHFLGWTYVGDQRVEFVDDDGRYDVVLSDLGLRKGECGQLVKRHLTNGR